MILVQYFYSTVEVEIVFGKFAPREIQEQLQAIELYRIISCSRVNACEFFDFLVKMIFDLKPPFFIFSTLAQFLQRYILSISAVFFFDCYELLNYHII